MICRFLFNSIFAPIYSRVIGLLAYGPWGRWIHQRLISGFRRLYSIEWGSTREYQTLGDFFLRQVRYTLSHGSLVSPAEAAVLEGPMKIQDSPQITVKGLTYRWEDFGELNLQRYQKNGVFFNFYLAPQNYHWVHCPCDGSDLKIYRHQGKSWPVNRLGRILQPFLYTENERLTFTWTSAQFGHVTMICVGALGVSRILCEKGDAPYGEWQSHPEPLKKGERMAGFRLGSTVLLILERAPTSTMDLELVRVGDALE